MKVIVFILLFIICCSSSFAQTVEDPAFEKSETPVFYIKKVEITKDTTYVFCLYYAEAGTWVSISRETFLRNSKSYETFPLLRCEGIPYSPERRRFSQNESCEFLFCFPSIAGIEQFDFIESEDERGFNIYGVNLKKKHKTSYTDAELNQISEIVSTCDSTDETEKKMLLKDHATSLNNLESYNASIGNYAETVRLGTIELHIREKVFGEEAPAYIELLGNLADYYAALGIYTDAIRIRTREVEVRKKVFGTKGSYYVNSLEDIAAWYKEIGNLTEVVRLKMEIANIIKNTYGINHVKYANSLGNLAFCNYEIGNYREAIEQGTEAIEIVKRIVGTDSINYARLLGNLGLCYYEIGDYREALRLEEETMDIYKSFNGTENIYYTTSLSRLADYNSALLFFDKAISFCTEAMENYKRFLGTEHPYYASSLVRLADYYSKIGNNSEAIKLGIEAKDIYKRKIGTDNSGYATLLNNLAGYYLDLGNYAETLKLMTEAKDIYETKFGRESSEYAISLNNLASYNSNIGNYSEAIRLGIEAMELYKKVFGTDHHLYALSLSNLASYNSNVGNYSEAIKYGTEAMEIYKRTLGAEHPNYASLLNILAISNLCVGNYSEAIRLGTEAKEIYKRKFGSDHPDYATSLNSLAGCYSGIGNYSEAIRLGKEALEIRKKVIGIEHPLYAMSLHNLAGYNSVLGNYSEAIRLGMEATHILKKVDGTGHPYYSYSLYQLASYYTQLGNYTKAFNCVQHSLDNFQLYVLRYFTELSSRTQENMWTYKYAYKFLGFLPNIVSELQTKQAISFLYDKTCLFAKGVLLNTGIEIRKLILESGDSILTDKYDALSSNISLYYRLLEKPIKERSVNTDSLIRVIERQEMILARESKAFGDYTHNLTINWKDVQRKLGDNDIAIEFLDFPIQNSDSTLYVALTLKKNYDSPHMVTLFEKEQLKAVPENVYYTQTDVADLVWKPLEEELEGVKNIYFSPSGELHRIGIEYLPVSKTENINDVYTFHRLSSTRQLAIIQDETKGENTILYGGINYDDKSKTISVDSTSAKGTVLRTAFSYRADVDSLSLRDSYDYLEGTKKETDLIVEDMKKHHIPYIYYCGTDGTEESFKRLDGTKPKVIHIATHGFYLTESEAEKSRLARPEMEILTEGGQKVGRQVQYKPMTRSGLLFSGCNHVIRHEQIPDGEDDGILTAQEISTLDLRGLDLVVLSACQTGLGDIVSGEGVFGLQRGFKKAGAKTIIMSLWNVNDESTMKMMTSFYHHYLEGKSKEEAFCAAQDELKKDCAFQHERPDWAAFIMLDGLN